jgi:hypothetical protein
MDSSSSPKPWLELYKAALFETDKQRVAQRIVDAERVIKDRARSLFQQPKNACAERTALDAALYALSILKVYTCIEPHGANGGAIPAKQQFRRNL